MSFAASAILVFGCIEDRNDYNYRQTPQITFLAADFECTAGDETEFTAPLRVSEEMAESAIDSVFEIGWYIDRTLVGEGYRIKYTPEKSGSFNIVFKVTNRETGEVFLSDSYSIKSASAIGWGWMVLSDPGDGSSSLSFIQPVTMHVSRKLEDSIEGGLGTEPRNLFYYNIFGTIERNAIVGLPKILVNQGSGSVTLDGTTLQKDMYLRDEFGGTEPAGLDIAYFGWDRPFYAICTKEGDLYIRDVDTWQNRREAYYGHYSTMPRTFDGGAKITCFQAFPNAFYLSADDNGAIMYDELNGRFLALVEGNDESFYHAGTVYLNYYDQDYTIPAGVPRLDAMGAGSRCLGLSSDQHVGTNPQGWIESWSKYVALMDMGGTGDYQIFTFTLNPLSWSQHIVTETSMTAFSGAPVMNRNSVVRMSSNFGEYPFLFFTDGEGKLYVYSYETGQYALAYEAPSAITGICPSPIVCYFQGFGANSTEPNFRLALSLSDGRVDIVDVAYEKLVRVFAGLSPDLLIREIPTFGDIKGVVWCTNIESEY